MTHPNNVLADGDLVVHDLTLRLDEARETLSAIRSGEVDALVVAMGTERQVFVLKGADHAHRVLLETLNEGALTVTADATVLYANQRFAEMVGRPLGRIVGRPLRDFVAPEEGRAFDALLAAAARGRCKGEISLHTATGALLPAMASMSAVEQEGSPTVTVVLTDLGPLKEAEHRLRRANDELEARVAARTAELSRANEALRAEVQRRTRLEDELRRNAEALQEADRRKDEFLSMLAHELRNPLAPIVTATEMMRMMSPDKAPLERYRGVIERQVRNLTRLVDDLLDVSRITRRVVTLQRQVVDLGPILQSAVEAARPLLDGAHHALRVTSPAHPVRVFADPTRIEQVLVNLLNNAAKYTKEGGFIQLSLEQDGGEATIRVRDNGMGIPPDLLPHVFDLFVQGDRTLERAQGGLGIGLTLVKSLVEMHGGHVEALSEGPGHGSELVVRLPLAALSPSVPAPHNGVVTKAAQGAGGRRRVLVIEDNADAAETLVALLELWGHEVRHAGDADAALLVAETFRPEVALVDIGLPGVDGYEVARRLRQSNGHDGERFLLIGLTGYGQDQDRSRSREAGFDHHLVKPADPEQLGRLVNGPVDF